MRWVSVRPMVYCLHGKSYVNKLMGIRHADQNLLKTVCSKFDSSYFGCELKSTPWRHQRGNQTHRECHADHCFLRKEMILWCVKVIKTVYVMSAVISSSFIFKPLKLVWVQSLSWFNTRLKHHDRNNSGSWPVKYPSQYRNTLLLWDQFCEVK